MLVEAWSVLSSFATFCSLWLLGRFKVSLSLTYGKGGDKVLRPP